MMGNMLPTMENDIITGTKVSNQASTETAEIHCEHEETKNGATMNTIPDRSKKITTRGKLPSLGVPLLGGYSNLTLGYPSK